MSTPPAQPFTGSRGQIRLTADDIVPDRALTDVDSDDFDYAAIADRLGDLVTVAQPPVNIALFGPWGSGKSSVYELLRRALESTESSGIRLVRYDAWKYGGASLQRNFISHVATELGFSELDPSSRPIRENRRFHRGLYERRRRADVDFRDLDRRWIRFLGPFAIVFAPFITMFVLFAGLISWLTGQSFFEGIRQSLPDFVAPTGVLAALFAVAKIILDGAKVEVEQSQPGTEEEFAKTFRELLGRARKDNRCHRFVFFVDELDRCSASDVVTTLTAIKTFLDQDDCVFIVAADRAVFECALETLPQATPVDEANPYYSSASAFLDKVFQHQIPLPPLRGRRLTRFARDLVASREGLWQDLRDRKDGNDDLFNHVIYVLIPSHVRSPRRVKVLLNAFATNVRIAEARGIDWRRRANEIAKLTVLQTEFPLLAADLRIEPRLPKFLLNAPDSPSPRVRKLLERHGGTATSSEVAALDLAEAASPDPPIQGSDQDIGRLKETQHAQLRRYLERSSGIPDPGRDLLYLEPAGAAFGLEDATLGDLIEADAPEAPDRVVAAVVERGVQEQLQAIRVLADMCEQEFGQERRHVMTALMGSVEAVGDHVTEVGRTIVAALASFQNEQPLADEHLVGALHVALKAERAETRPLAAAVFARPELLATPERLETVARMLRSIPREFRGKVYERLAEGFAEDRSVVMKVLAALENGAALELLQAEVCTYIIPNVSDNVQTLRNL